MTNTSAEESTAQAIKSFLYLDEYKMYSISSQIFGGLTEYLIDYHETTREDEERQSGPLGSGRVMANILKSESRTAERKYLHDYSYSLFEAHLKENGKVLSVSEDNINGVIDCVNDFGFVEVRARAVFNDMRVIRSTITNFNALGEALAYVTNIEQIQEVQQQAEAASNTVRDRNQRARLREQTKALTDLENMAKLQGLHLDPTFLTKLGFLLEYGFQDQFEVQMTIGEYPFSAILKREYLREAEHLLVRKYSRFSEKRFVLLGTIAQSPGTPPAVGSEYIEEGADDSTPSTIKGAIMAMVSRLFQMESSFSGKSENEAIIDPNCTLL